MSQCLQSVQLIEPVSCAVQGAKCHTPHRLHVSHTHEMIADVCYILFIFSVRIQFTNEFSMSEADSGKCMLVARLCILVCT